MRCIYFSGEKCYAHSGSSNLTFTPSAEEKKELCENGEKFKDCPRLKALLEHLAASNAK